MTLPSPAFWQRKSVLVTGHTGFKGCWLMLWLQRMGAKVSGLALAPETTPNLFDLVQRERSTSTYYCDIRAAQPVADIVRRCDPEIVLHLAAQPIVRKGYTDPLPTFETNVMGTANLLDALRHSDRVRSIVVVTTDKVYRNGDDAHRENDALGGTDPYSASKSAAEHVAHSFREAFFRPSRTGLATARADWAADRLLPDAVRAWSEGRPLLLRRPDAIRPWQHVLDPLCGYLVLAERLWSDPDGLDALNFAPAPEDQVTVRQLVTMAAPHFCGEVEFEENAPGVAETAVLRLDGTLAKRILGVVARWSVGTSVDRTMTWYRALQAGEDARALCGADIDAFEAA
jgi:CDP-glucose 4,6-dehydratase